MSLLFDKKRARPGDAIASRTGRLGGDPGCREFGRNGGEMETSDIFLALALASIAWGVVSAIMITSYLSARGTRINILFFRIMVLKYIHQYHELTKKERGKPGPWFYSYIASMNLALAFAIIGAIFRNI